MLIAAGADVVHVSKQLGHADPAITLRVYADEFKFEGVKLTRRIRLVVSRTVDTPAPPVRRR